MSKDDPFVLLKDFVYWVRLRRPLCEAARDAWVSGLTLEYVTQGIERFLDGKKNPWPKRQGNRAKRDLMWESYWLSGFAEKDSPHLPQHSEEGGAFTVVGERLKISAKTVETHTRNARTLLSTKEGVREFQEWLTAYRNNRLSYLLFPANHPRATAERERREAAGVGTRKRRKIVISGEIDAK